MSTPSLHLLTPWKHQHKSAMIKTVFDVLKVVFKILNVAFSVLKVVLKLVINV